MARRRGVGGIGSVAVLSAVLLVGCGAAPPAPPDPADNAAAVALLLGAAGEVCAQTSGVSGIAADLTEQALRAFDEVRLLGTVAVPDALVGTAHEQWWLRYLAARRAALLEVIDSASEELLTEQQRDPGAWRRAAHDFQSPLAALSDREQRELAAMRAGAQAAADITGGPGAVVLGEVERRLAERLGLTACNPTALDGSLDEQVPIVAERERLDAIAEVLIGEP